MTTYAVAIYIKKIIVSPFKKNSYILVTCKDLPATNLIFKCS